MSVHNNKNSSPKLRHIATILAGIALSALSSATLAADPANTDNVDEKARWFQIELILFSQQTDLALDAEQWPLIEGLSLPEKLLELNLPQPTASAAGPSGATNDTVDDAVATESVPVTEQDPANDIPAEEGSDMPTAYQILAADQLQLTEMAEKIRRSAKRDLLLHIAWQQPTDDRQQAEPVYLFEGMTEPLPIEETAEDEDQAGNLETAPVRAPTVGAETLPLMLEAATEDDIKIGPVNPRFAGTVTLSVERYLHIATDLIYRRPVMQHRPVPIPDLALWYDRPYPTLQEPQGPAYQQITWQAMRGFQLKESRRMRSTEIHYLDHPFMGMVVVITPVELPEPAEEIQQTSPQNILSAPAKPRTSP